MTDYYISSIDGDDGDDGTSEGTAWQSPSKIWSLALHSDDRVFFKRGSVFAQPLRIAGEHVDAEAGHPVIIDAYGTGAKPIFSQEIDLTGSWTEDSGGFYVHTGCPEPIARLYFNGDTAFGTHRFSKVTCVAQGDHWYDAANGQVYLYSPGGNPNSYYSAITASQVYTSMYFVSQINGAHHVRVRNLAFDKCGLFGLYLYNTADILTELCDFAWCGGGEDPYNPGVCDGYGLNIVAGSTNTMEDIESRYCTFDHQFGVAVSLQSYKANLNQRLKVHHNIMTNCWGGVEMGPLAATATFQDCYICNNVMYNFGYGVFGTGYGTYVGTTARGIRLYTSGTTQGTMAIKNNIMHTIKWAWLYPGNTYDLAQHQVDYNTYYGGDAQFQYQTDSKTLAEWQAATGQDAHSIDSDPGFATLGSDWHAASGSSAIVDAGTDAGLGYPYLGAAPDMGIYEYDAPNILKRCPFRKAV